MKFFFSIIVMALVSFATCLYFPWWSIAPVCFLVTLLIPQKPGLAFLAGFIAMYALWGGLSFWLSSNNGHILAHRVSPLIISVDNPLLLIAATGLIGAIVGGFAALTAGIIRYGSGQKQLL